MFLIYLSLMCICKLFTLTYTNLNLSYFLTYFITGTLGTDVRVCCFIATNPCHDTH